MNEQNIDNQLNQNQNPMPEQPYPQDLQNQNYANYGQVPQDTQYGQPAPAPQTYQQPEVQQNTYYQQQPEQTVPVQEPVYQQPVTPPPVHSVPVQPAANNGTYAPTTPINGIDNVGFIAVGQPIKKKKNKGFLIFIGIIVTILLGLLIYFVGFPFVIKTFLSDPRNVYDVTITNLSKAVTDTSKTLLYDKAIYNIAVDLDTNIEGLDNFSGYNYSWRIGIDPTEKFFEYGYGIKDKYDKDYSYSAYIKNERVYERYSTFDGLLYLGNTTDYANQEITANYNEFNDFIKKYGNNNFSYLINKTSALFIESLDENKLTKEDASIAVNGKFIKTINNKYTLDKDNMQRTKKYIIEGLMNDEKALEIISTIKDIGSSQLKVDMMEEADEEVSIEDEVVISIYTYGASNEIVGIELQKAKNFKLQHFYKDGDFNTFIYVKSVVDGETTEKTYNIDGIKNDSVTNVTMMSDNKKYMTLKITDLENGKSFDYNLHEEFFADEVSDQAITTVAGNLTIKNDMNDKRNKYIIDFSIKNKDDYLKANVIASADWTSDVANINTNDISTVDSYSIGQQFENELANRTPFGMLYLLFNLF